MQWKYAILPGTANKLWEPHRNTVKWIDCHVPKQTLCSDGFFSFCLLLQVIRSVSKWSAGVDTEQSIQSAYLEIIKNAEHFIYIEVC